MSQNIVSNTSDNRESNKSSQLIRVTKWLFWITVCLYIVHTLASYYLDWDYPFMVDSELYAYSQLLHFARMGFWYLTLLMLLISIISCFRSSPRTSKMGIGAMIIVIFFTIFGPQVVGPVNYRGTGGPANCIQCGRPFWSRGFFFKKNREAKKSNTTSWATIKK